MLLLHAGAELILTYGGGPLSGIAYLVVMLAVFVYVHAPWVGAGGGAGVA